MIGEASSLSACQTDTDAETEGPARARERDARLTAIVRAEYAFLWRSVRRLGVAARDADDAAQRVLSVLARRIGEVRVGSERAFLFQTALRVAAEMRRGAARARLSLDPSVLAATVDDAPLPDSNVEQREARELLDRVLDGMPLDLRAVFVLYELEQMTTVQIAALLDVPPGTVSSRLRRGREQFESIARRLRAQLVGHQRGGR